MVFGVSSRMSLVLASSSSLSFAHHETPAGELAGRGDAGDAIGAELVGDGPGHSEDVVEGLERRLGRVAGAGEDVLVVVEDRRRRVEGHDIVLALVDADFAGIVVEIGLERIGVDIGREVGEHATIGEQAVAGDFQNDGVGRPVGRDGGLQLGDDVVVVADEFGLDVDVGIGGFEVGDDLVERLTAFLVEAVPELDGHRRRRENGAGQNGKAGKNCRCEATGHDASGSVYVVMS